MKKLVSIIKNEGVAVLKTDTLYGIVGLAKNQHVVDRIYEIKKRHLLKPVIVLVSSISDIEGFGLVLSEKVKEILHTYWPGTVSIILPVPDVIDLHHVHKGTGGVAFRIPDDEKLRELLKETGPLIAPSANHEGETPAKNIKEAMRYFSDEVDYYDDGGQCQNDKASKILKISEDGEIEIIRK